MYYEDGIIDSVVAVEMVVGGVGFFVVFVALVFVAVSYPCYVDLW